MNLKLLAAIAASFILTFSAMAGQNPPQPAAGAKCPVCGMFVAKYPDWVVSLTFRDSSAVFFDGAKDMFNYYQNLKKYSQSRKTADVASITVKDYYDLKPAEGKKAFYVIGSDVFGPMGKELIPFSKEADAREFLKDHKGKKILRFDELTTGLLKSLE